MFKYNGFKNEECTRGFIKSRALQELTDSQMANSCPTDDQQSANNIFWELFFTFTKIGT